MSHPYPPLAVKNLGKTFLGKKPFTAVRDLSFELRTGEILGLLGPNGAGKSTTIQMLLGTLTPSAGEVRYFGELLSTQRSKILQQVGYVSGYSQMPWNLTVRENLEVQGRLFGLSRAARAHRMNELMQVFQITDLKDKLAKSLSAGQSTRAMLARAFMGSPKVVLLDEPTASLDPDIAVQVRAFVVQQAKEQGVSLLYTSHNMTEVAEICDRVIFLQKGAVAAVDTPAELAKKAALTKLRLLAPPELHPRIHAALSNHGSAVSNTGWVEIAMDHHLIPPALHSVHACGVELQDLEVEKPTLEDFFLKLSSAKEAA
ncbi:MAG: ABC transporter ATP-binding protein [Proteobacteria bacterium]|nr:ABC transporter ATP-binding protein [Pseudomonadota bacterium]